MKPEPWEPQRIWVVDPDWRVGSTRQCRTLTNRKRCPNQAVAEFKRHTRQANVGYIWEPHCEEHLFGRRLHDGKILTNVHPDSPLAMKAALEHGIYELEGSA